MSSFKQNDSVSSSSDYLHSLEVELETLQLKSEEQAQTVDTLKKENTHVKAHNESLKEQVALLVRQDKPGVSSGWNSRPGKSGARSPGIESWAYGGNDMS